ncbi:hypothetical protein AURDEDRAFT_159229 [Auricularia subglabra TFB-10046 SS5]|nr:hypothetical protein AURDEDRAFT_159229 [Auricularia subglabra TFB-10046 SS5]
MALLLGVPRYEDRLVGDPKLRRTGATLPLTMPALSPRSSTPADLPTEPRFPPQPSNSSCHHGRLCWVWRIPVELWLDVLGPDNSDRLRRQTVLAFSAVCAHSRWIAFRHIAPAATLYSRQLFMLDVNLKRLRKNHGVSPFDTTSKLRVLGQVRDFAPLPAAVTSAFGAITSLELILRPVPFPLTPSMWEQFGSSLSQLHVLCDVRGLSHLSLYLFVDHNYQRTVVDIAELQSLATLHSLRSLALRVTGGAEITAYRDFLLPPSLGHLRVSVEVLSLIDRRAWTSALTDFGSVEVEDLRGRCHLRRATHADAARQLSSAVAPALPGWVATLRTLRLVDVTIDYTAIRALATLVRLTRLDFHPSGLELTAQECSILERDCPPSTTPPTSINRLRLSGRGGYNGAVAAPLWSRLASLTTPMKHLLCRLADLRVLHLATTGELWASPQDAAALTQQHHLSLFTTLERHILPSLSIWNFGNRDRDDSWRYPYLHLPTCRLCASLPDGRRSQDCLAVESRVIQEEKARVFDLSHSDIQEKFASEPL